MKKKKTKMPSWVDAKKSLRNYESSQIIGIVKELYQLSEENKTFLDARCLGGDESIKRFKKII